MKRRSCALPALAGLAAALALTPSAPVFADQNTGTVRGIVRLTDGRPICGLRVRVESEREMTWTAYTDKAGSYAFLSIYPGDVSVVFPTLLPTVVRRAHVSPNLYTDVNVSAQRHLAQHRRAHKADLEKRCGSKSYAVDDVLYQ